MIVIADSGSTKTHWVLIEDRNHIREVYSKGINPYFCTDEDLNEIIENTFGKHRDIESFYYYGAGCANQEMINRTHRLLTEKLSIGNIEIHSDLLGAARSLCGKNAGIACIMGTGSNSCFYDGEKIVKNISPLGFILGDEGSGAVLGRLFVGACLKNQLPAHVASLFMNRFKLSPEIILERVYRSPYPNRFLAGFSPFILEMIEEPTVNDLVKSSFRDFFVKNILQYDIHHYPVHFIGSIAYNYSKVLKDTGKEFGLTFGNIEISPMNGLLQFHLD